MTLPDSEQTYADILAKLHAGEHFAISRWGDGEFSCLFGWPGENCDGHEYYPDLGKRLRAIVEGAPAYMMGLQPFAVRMLGNRFTPKYRNPSGFEWVNADAFHDAAKTGRLGEFKSALACKEVLLVGPSYLRPLGWPMVTIPVRDCWKTHEWTRGMILRRCRHRKPDVIVLCASMMANVLVDELWTDLGGDVTLIDVGSVFDPECGKYSRRYQRKAREKNDG